MAFWNAPLDVPAHASKAIAAALAMRAALADFNAARGAKAALDGHAWRPAIMGIGVNAGPCSVGNMGSTRRFDYSVLGDTVNLASRLEGVSKLFDVDIIASASVRDAATEGAWLGLGEIVVIGRSAPTAIFAIAGDDALARTVAFRDWRAAHDEMLEHYRARRFGEAAALATRLSAQVAPSWRGLYMRLENRYAALAGAPPGRLDSGVDSWAKSEARDVIDEVVRKYWSRLAADHAQGAWEALDAGYGARDGGYHDWSHIAHLLRALDAFRGLAAKPALVATAAFWHDAVYVTREPDGRRRRDVENVRASAELFRRHALMDARDADAVHEMIMATANHMRAAPSQERYEGFGGDLELFLDLDLSPLAVSWKRSRDEPRQNPP